jgi:hypothetical protein
MPLALTQNEETESGHDYNDVLGVSYEYPIAYRQLVEPGVEFVYYRGRKKKGGGTQPQVYLGMGRVGAVKPSSHAGRLVCLIEDYKAFDVPVPFKGDGKYLETGAQPLGPRAGLYFRRGVRRIDEDVYRRICTLGGL